MDSNLLSYFFDSLKVLDDKYHHNPLLKFNADETKLDVSDVRNPKLYVSNEIRKIAVPSNSSVGEQFTLMVCVNIRGIIPKTLLITKLLTLPELPSDFTDHFVLTHQESGWMNGKVLHDWLTQIFIPTVYNYRKKYKLPESERALLFLDSHSTRQDASIKTLLNDHFIDLVILPPHSTTILQPLDILVFGAFKKEFSSDFQELMNYLDGNDVSLNKRTAILKLAHDTLLSTCTIRNCRKGFIRSGLEPINSLIPLSSTLVVNASPLHSFAVTPFNRLLRLDNEIYVADYSDSDDSDYVPE